MAFFALFETLFCCVLECNCLLASVDCALNLLQIFLKKTTKSSEHNLRDRKQVD